MEIAVQINKIIGWVGAAFFENYLDQLLSTRSSNEEQLAIERSLFRLDQLTASQIAAIVNEILQRPLHQYISLKIPRVLVEGESLPENVLINENAASVRNQSIDNLILLTASSKNDIGDTLAHITIVSAKELRSSCEEWVKATCKLGDITLTDEDEKTFIKAFQGMSDAIELSLVQIAEFCISVRDAIKLHGYSIRNAIGWSLPSIGLPRDTAFFSNAKSFSQSVRPWRSAFEKLAAHRLPLLKYQKPNGQPLDKAEMEERLKDNKDEIDDEVQVVLTKFIEGSIDNVEAIKDLSELEWEQDKVYLIFDRPKEKLKGLADSTLSFFINECDTEDVLSDAWKLHLDELKTRERSNEWNEEDKVFFDLHRHYLEQDTKLYARWEKAIFGQPIECNDFLEGLVSATYQLLAGQEPSNKEKYLRVSVNKQRKAWVEHFNHDVMSYFSVMYRGIYHMMGDKIIWDSPMRNIALSHVLFDFDNFIAQQKERLGKKFKSITSLSRTALQLKFEVALVERHQDTALDKVLKKTQLLWTYTPNHIGMSLADDLGRLLEKGGVACTQVYRRIVSKKGGVQSVSLDDVSTLEATFANDAGSLVPSTSKLMSQRADIKRRIDELWKEKRLSDEQKKEIRDAWDKFETKYPIALEDFLKHGLHSASINEQADAYAYLLDTLLLHACNDVSRGRLVNEVLSVGTVQVIGEQPTLIIPPWHPERLKSLSVRIQRVCALVHHLLESDSIKFGDRNIFFKEFFEELRHPFYPEVAITKVADSISELVTVTSTTNGYSLLERPIKVEAQLSDTSPNIAAKQVRELIERYLSLQPHKISHLRVLLYNIDAADLPLSVIKELSGFFNTEDTDMQCSVSVRHTNTSNLASIYAELVNKSAVDVDLPLVSEISENFISRLRIAVSNKSDYQASVLEFKPFDIAFLFDVVSRTAVLEWLPVTWSEDRPSLEHAPSRWSYRRVAGDGELKATTFLTCPWQTQTGWSYLAAIAAVDKKEAITKEQRLLPARQISLQHPQLAEIIDDAHQQAEWVATYDELLDKRQLQHRDITVVRYRRDSTNGRNMIVSSTADLRLLGTLTRRRLLELGFSLDSQILDEVIERIKKDALSISGQIVLRAARRGVSSGEMLGLILSRYLIADELKILNPNQHAFTTFFLLDDYASWFSQKENRIADLLAISIQEVEDDIRIYVAVVESKYVTYEGVADARRSSKTQLMSTLMAFSDALFGDPSRLDRDVWLARLSDLLVDSDVPIGHTTLLERARIAIREGRVSISLRGYSHVFVHSADIAQQGSISTQEQLDGSYGIQAWQEVFDRNALRSLVTAYINQEDSAPIRTLLGSDEPWEIAKFNKPAPRVNWVVNINRSPISLSEDATLQEAKLPISDTETQIAPKDAAQKNLDSIPQTSDIAVVIEPQEKETASISSTGMGAFDQLISAKKTSQSNTDSEREIWAEQVTKNLKKALNGWGFQVNVLGTRLTPNGCLVRLAGSDRLRIEDIESKRTQLLTTHAINVVTVQPKPGEIVVTIASDKRQSVSLWDLWARRQLNRNSAGMNVSFVIGVQEVNGELLYLNLGGDFAGLSGHEPHSLVAGATGSGKSVLLQVLLLDIAATNTKDLAQIILIDPKMGVDYAALGDLPHMREPIITTKERSTEVLANLVEEMESRYRLFAQAKARDLATYNTKVLAQDRLPMVFLVHDEFADWMFDDAYKEAVGAAVQRLGVKARAAGIHLIFAAQRPDKDVMPMQLRENLGNRLILKVASEATSKIALDRAGAERLLGRGHLAAKLSGELIFAQVPFVSDEDIGAIMSSISTAK